MGSAAMKKRVIWKMFALTVLTLGIYRLYWFINTRKELINQNPKVKILSPWALIIPFILVAVSALVFIFSSVQDVSTTPSYCSAYAQGSSLNEVALPSECQNEPAIWPMLVFYAAFILVYPLVVFWLWGYSKAVDIVTKGKTNFAIAMIVLLLVPDGIDILIMQDVYNKLSLAKT